MRRLCSCLLALATCVGGCSRHEGYFPGADNTRLYYHAEGSGSSTVVVVHGIGSGSGYLAPDLAPLADSRVLLYYDQRGFGHSELLTDAASLRLEKHVADLDALRQRFGFDRITLLGHSWGGLVAGAYAAAHPNRVERMLLVEPSVPAFSFVAGMAERDRKLKSVLSPAAAARADSLADTMATASDPSAVCKAFFKDLGAPVFFRTPDAARRSRGEFCSPADSMRNMATVARLSYGATVNENWDLRPRLASVTAPTLVMYGEEGPLGPEPMKGWAAALRNARLFSIREAQHYPYVDRPEVFFPAAEQFLRGMWPGESHEPDR